MGCPSECEIGTGRYVVFSVCTHDPDTGVLTDADSVPTYRIYEEETGTAILDGSMAKLDDTNTTGFYTESIECTSANGFENGKNYTIYISATVDAETGGICYTFKAYDGRIVNSLTATAKGEINAEIDSALDTAITASPTGDSINDWIRAIKYALVNQMEITEATGSTTIRKDDSSTEWVTVAAAFSTAAGITTRKRLEA